MEPSRTLLVGDQLQLGVHDGLALHPLGVERRCSDNPQLGNPSLEDAWRNSDAWEFPAYNWIDLAATVNFARHFQWTIGINNVFDEEPPVAAGISPNDYGPGMYGTYDPWGRTVFSSLQFTF